MAAWWASLREAEKTYKETRESLPASSLPPLIEDEPSEPNNQSKNLEAPSEDSSKQQSPYAGLKIAKAATELVKKVGITEPSAAKESQESWFLDAIDMLEKWAPEESDPLDRLKASLADMNSDGWATTLHTFYFEILLIISYRC